MENQTIKDILQRRSIRAFKGEQLSEADIQTIINCGLYAPSAMNRQPWHFTILCSKELIDYTENLIRELTLAASDPATLERLKSRNFKIFYNAPTLILVSGEDINSWAFSDCSNAVTTMALAAQALGIGSCFIGAASAINASDKAEEYRVKTQLPPGYTPAFFLALGYTEGVAPEPKPRRENLVSYL